MPSNITRLKASEEKKRDVKRESVYLTNNNGEKDDYEKRKFWW